MNTNQNQIQPEPQSESKTPSATKRYLWRVVVAMSAYMGSLILAKIFVESGEISGPPAYLLVTFSGLMLASMFWIYARFIIEEQDEYIRLINVRQSMIATGFALTLAGMWGSLEAFDLAFHVDAYWWPTLWCFGIGIGALYHWLTGWYRDQGA